MQRILRTMLSTFTVAAATLVGFAAIPSTQAVAADTYTEAPKLEHYKWDTCPNKHYMHVAEWTYCLNGNVKGHGDSGTWYWNDNEKTLTFESFILRRQNFTGSYGAGTFVELVFDRSTVGVDELTVKYRGENIIDQQSKGHSDALALMFTMKSGGVTSKQENPKVNLIGESEDATLTINTDISASDPNYSNTIESWGAPLKIGGKGTINLNPGYTGTAKLAGAAGISANLTITDDAIVNINSKIANPQTVATKRAVIGVDGPTVLSGNSKLNIDVKGVNNGLTIGMFNSRNNKDIAITENASLNVTATSPNMRPYGIRNDAGNVTFSSARDAVISAVNGRAIYAKGTATFSGPGDVTGVGSADASLQAGKVNLADGYGVFQPSNGKIANPGVEDEKSAKMDNWLLSILPPRYELVKTSPAKAVESPVVNTMYSQNNTKRTYSAQKTIEVNGKTWTIDIDADSGKLTVTPSADALKGEKAYIPVKVSYTNPAFTEVKERFTTAQVVVSEATATPEAPTAQDLNVVPKGSWQDVVIPSYDPNNGVPNPLNGVFKYEVTYVNNDGKPFNPNDPATKGKKAVVTVSLTDKGSKHYTKLACPAGAKCELNADGTVKFTIDLTFKPGTPDNSGDQPNNPGTQPGDSGTPGDQPNNPGAQPGGDSGNGAGNGADAGNGAGAGNPDQSGAQPNTPRLSGDQSNQSGNQSSNNSGKKTGSEGKGLPKTGATVSQTAWLACLFTLGGVAFISRKRITK